MEVAGTAASLTPPSGLGLNIIEHQRCRLDNKTRTHAINTWLPVLFNPGFVHVNLHEPV